MMLRARSGAAHEEVRNPDLDRSKDPGLTAQAITGFHRLMPQHDGLRGSHGGEVVGTVEDLQTAGSTGTMSSAEMVQFHIQGQRCLQEGGPRSHQAPGVLLKTDLLGAFRKCSLSCELAQHCLSALTEQATQSLSFFPCHSSGSLRAPWAVVLGGVMRRRRPAPPSGGAWEGRSVDKMRKRGHTAGRYTACK